MRWYLSICLLFSTLALFAQNRTVSRLRQERIPASLHDCYDVNFYDLEIKLNVQNRRIAGSSTIRFTARESFSRMRIDLAQQLQVARITFRERNLSFTRQGSAIIIEMGQQVGSGSRQSIDILFGGEAPLADLTAGIGGINWEKDDRNRPMIFSEPGANGIGLWWPHKDQMEDPADSMRFNIIFDEAAKIIAPGTLERISLLPGKFRRWMYTIDYPISPEAVYFAIGDFIRAEEQYFNESGTHTLYYYAHASQRPYVNQRLGQVRKMIACMENYFGTYPFWDRGFYLLESESLRAADRSVLDSEKDTGFEKWLFRLVAAEWFGKSLRPERESDNWISTSMIGYAESLFVTYLENEAAGVEYLFQRKEQELYNKAWLLHNLRLLVDNDQQWWESLESFTRRFKYQRVSTVDVIDFFNERLQRDYSYYFKQYINFDLLPVLEIAVKKNRRKLTFSYRWKSPVSNFEMPVDIWIHGVHQRLIPTSEWQSFTRKRLAERHIRIDEESGLFEVKKMSLD